MKCKICSSNFKKYKSNQLTCSQRCRKKYYNKLSLQWYYRNRERQLEMSRIYSKTSRGREFSRINVKKYYQSEHGRKKISERMKKFRQTDEFKKWRLLQREKDYSRTYALRHNQRESQCSECSSRFNLHFHHTNYQRHEGYTVCSNCHGKLHRKPIEVLAS